jgi:cytochrome c peroxidase
MFNTIRFYLVKLSQIYISYIKRSHLKIKIINTSSKTSDKKSSKPVFIGALICSTLLSNSLYAQEAPGGRGGRGGGGPVGGPPGDPRGGPGDRNGGRQVPNPINDLKNAQENLQTLITQLSITAPSEQGLALPTINDEKAQLGKKLFFAKNLGGEQSSACVSCHHPMLGGGDDLSLPVGVDAVNSLEQSSHALLGQGRFNGNGLHNLPLIPRNSPTIFNIGLNNRALFWDGRVETTRNGNIITPDSALNADGRRMPDSNLPQGTTLAAAQARFPVTYVEEMRGDFSPESDNQQLRNNLAQRFANTDQDFTSDWPQAFTQAFGNDEVNFDRIAEALGEYERSMTFINSPWKNYLDGDDNALTDEQKVGAILFFTSRRDGGAGCAGCHRGSTLASNRFNLVAYPQIGSGKGNDTGTLTSNDFGRENVTNDTDARYHFRAPSLLNIEVTAPYGHTGAYQTLEEVVAHYNNPRQAIDRLFATDANGTITNDAPFCQLPQIRSLIEKNNQSCQNLYPDAYQNSLTVVEHLEQAREGDIEARSPLRGRTNMSAIQVASVASFMRSLTDPCVKDSSCLAPWIIDENDRTNFPDDQPLVGHDQQGIDY